MMLSLILPTYNEAENLPELFPKIEEALAGLPHEIIVIDDDSPDETWRIAQGFEDRIPHLHVIRRVGRRGLSSAVVEGFLSARGDIFAVMDADGQHDHALLVQLHDAIRGGANVAIGSRYIDGGSVGEWDERRHTLSRIATALAVRFCRVRARDPMSGFFALDRRTFEATFPRLNPKGFKILLDILVHAPRGTQVAEIPFRFGRRLHGESKLSMGVQLAFLEELYDVTLGRFIPLTFVKYCIVGTLGIGVHLAAYTAFSSFLRSEGISLFGFSLSLIGAIETAVIFNFTLNNLWTFARERLRGSAVWLGLLKFNAACAVGALANYAVSAYLFTHGTPELGSVIIGAFVGVFWNYTMNRIITWRA